MRTRSQIVRAIGQRLSTIGLILIAVIMVYGAVWSIDPPWSVNELEGSVVDWGKQETPNVVIRYYKMLLFVRTDDGRDIGVSSNRSVAPRRGDRVLVQERVGLLGTRSFVEISAAQK